MNFIAILAALGLEQWRAFQWRNGVQRLFGRYARFLERHFNAGTEHQGALTASLAMGPPVAIAAAGYWALDALHPLLGLVWNVAILYLLVGFRHFSHAFTAIGDALRAGDAIGARKRLVAWRGADASASAQLVVDPDHVFGTLFWFLVLPGPGGAVLYRLTVLLAGQWQGVAVTPIGHQLDSFGRPVQRLSYWLDWIPVRLTALTFAIVGDFEDAVYCWRVQAKQWPSLHDGILLASEGSLADGRYVTVTVTVTSKVAVDTQLRVNPGNIAVTVLLSIKV